VVSTWSLHRTLETVTLLELPALLAAHGYDAVQIVHFHLAGRDPGYLAELRSELAHHHLALDTFLVDDGDLTRSIGAAADEDWISEWIADAALLGAPRARIIAGRSAPTPHTIVQSAAALKRLAVAHPHMRLVIENWHELTPDAASVNAILDATEGSVGLLVDLANWSGPNVCEELGRIANRAETCHAKARIGSNTEADAEGARNFVAALEAIRTAGFTGSLAMVYDGPDPDEWGMLEREREIITGVFR
jgi:sugar phosphate isomerase/epimerase